MQRQRLYRSRSNRVIAGVCAGIGAAFGIDPTIVRIVFVLLGLPGGAPGIVLYLICWLFMPEEPAGL
jgi:phage shock protein C